MKKVSTTIKICPVVKKLLKDELNLTVQGIINQFIKNNFNTVQNITLKKEVKNAEKRD